MGKVWGIEVRDFETSDGYVYQARLHGEDTRNGFKHVCSADWWMDDVTIHYYNRTWESYRYQSVLQKSISLAISAEQERLRDDWMHERGYQLMTAKRQADFDAAPPTSDYLQRLQSIAAQL